MGIEAVACHIMGLPTFKTTGNPRFDFDNTISMLAAKWCPYNCMEILEVYFQHSPHYKEQILRSLS